MLKIGDEGGLAITYKVVGTPRYVPSEITQFSVRELWGELLRRIKASVRTLWERVKWR